MEPPGSDRLRNDKLFCFIVEAAFLLLAAGSMLADTLSLSSVSTFLQPWVSNVTLFLLQSPHCFGNKDLLETTCIDLLPLFF